MKKSKKILEDFYWEENEKSVKMGIMPIEVGKRCGRVKVWHMDENGEELDSLYFTVTIEFIDDELHMAATTFTSDDSASCEVIGSCNCTEAEWDEMDKQEKENLICEGVVGYMNEDLVGRDVNEENEK